MQKTSVVDVRAQVHLRTAFSVDSLSLHKVLVGICFCCRWFFGGSGALSPFPKAPTYDGPGRQYAI